MKRDLLTKGIVSLLFLAFTFVSFDQETRRPGKIFHQPFLEKPHDRAAQEFLMLRDPNSNSIPRAIHLREQEFAKQLPKRSSSSQISKGLLKSSITPTWAERGPNNVGGRTRGLVVDISNPQTLIAGGVSGGVWKSTNDGITWKKTTNSDQIHSVTCITQDKRVGKNAMWYAGTGEWRGNSARISGDGIFKSIDNGESWFLLSSTSDGNPASDIGDFDFVWNLSIDLSRTDQDILYAATWKGIFRTSDGGLSWVRSVPTANPSNNFFITDVAVTPLGVVYACLNRTFADIWRSVDGLSWVSITPTTFPSQFGRIVIGLSPSNPNLAYFFVEATNGTEGIDQVNNHQLWKYVYLSGDGSGIGGSWVNRGANLPSTGPYPGQISTQGGYDMLCQVKPDDENFVLIGGTNLYRSTDAFATKDTWDAIGGYPFLDFSNLPMDHHPDLHSGAFSPSDFKKYYSGHDGGISRTNDITASPISWASLNNGYNVTQFYSVSLDPTSNSDAALGGTQDNGSLYATGPSASGWVSRAGGDGGFAEIAPLAEDRIYTSFQWGEIVSQHRNGTFIQLFKPPAATGISFIHPFTFDPNNPAILYFPGGNSDSTSGIWRNDSANHAGNPVAYWKYLQTTNIITSPGSGPLPPNGFVTGGWVTAVGVSKNMVPNVVYFGTRFGRVYRVDNANQGVSPKTTLVRSDPAFGWVNCIAVDPTNSRNVLVAYSNYNVESLWYSSDGGSNWIDVEGNLAGTAGPSIRWATIFHISGIQHVFLGTSVGLFFTSHFNGSSTTWVQEAVSEIGNVVVPMIDFRGSDNTLAVATHGRGIFTAQISLPAELWEWIPDYFLAQNFPNPFNPRTTIPFSLPISSFVKVRIYDIQGRLVREILSKDMNAGNHEVEFNGANLSSGVYVYALETPQKRVARKMILLK